MADTDTGSTPGGAPRCCRCNVTSADRRGATRDVSGHVLQGYFMQAIEGPLPDFVSKFRVFFATLADQSFLRVRVRRLRILPGTALVYFLPECDRSGVETEVSCPELSPWGQM
jgi:hypothetical protein